MNNEKSNWQQLSSKKIYENPWFVVEEDQVINPRGGQNLYGKVHFKNKAIGIIPIDFQRNTWLVGQHRYPLHAYSWEIPMGGGPIGKDVLASAKRELKEETGLTAVKWTNIMRIHTSNSVTDEEGFVFLAEDLTQGATEFDETEDLALWKLPLSEAVERVMAGEITDGISVAGLLKVARIFHI